MTEEEARRKEELDSSRRENRFMASCQDEKKGKGSGVSNDECIHGSNVDGPSWYGSKALILGLAA